MRLWSKKILQILAAGLVGGWAGDPAVLRAEHGGFVDVTVAVGLDFKHQNGAAGQRYLPETYGSGGALLDYDNDGWLDIYLVDGGRLPGLSQAPKAPNVLYRNSAEGHFTAVVEAAGAADEGYGMGAVAADYDNDGDVDLYVTNFGPNVLFRNDDGVFKDVTDSAQVGDTGWGSSAAFADVDADGFLDLYVGNYLEYPTEDPLACTIGNSDERIYCDPRKFAGQVDRLYRNGGAELGWVFSDWTQKAGLAQTVGKELGVVFTDFDLDGDQDLYLANDLTPNLLMRNDGGVFVERGLASGTSLNDEGQIEAGMGVDAGDTDGDGWPDLYVTNFQWESNTLYRNLKGRFFNDATVDSRLNAPSLPFLGFGTGFLDYDLDGDLDIFVANGHVYDNAAKVDRSSHYAQRNQLLRNNGSGVFAEVEPAVSGLVRTEVSRGAAFGDYDNDGDTDILVTNSNGPAVLLQNAGGASANWLGIELVGMATNSQGIGARVVLHAGGRIQVRQVRAGSSYLCSSDSRLLFGLGKEKGAVLIEVHWPSGTVQRLEQVEGGRYLIIEEKAS
jgi:enediyne biosynthesis protein E4